MIVKVSYSINVIHIHNYLTQQISFTPSNCNIPPFNFGFFFSFTFCNFILSFIIYLLLNYKKSLRGWKKRWKHARWTHFSHFFFSSIQIKLIAVSTTSRPSSVWKLSNLIMIAKRQTLPTTWMKVNKLYIWNIICTGCRFIVQYFRLDLIFSFLWYAVKMCTCLEQRDCSFFETNELRAHRNWNIGF